MKGKPNPRYSREQVRKEIARRLKAEAESAQLRAQMQSLHEQMKRIQGGIDKVAVSILETLYVKV